MNNKIKILLPNQIEVVAGGESSLMELGEILSKKNVEYVRMPFGKMNIIQLIHQTIKLLVSRINREKNIHYVIPEVFLPYLSNSLTKISYSIICLNHRYIGKNWPTSIKNKDIENIYLNANFIICHPGECYSYLKLLYPTQKIYKLFFSKNYDNFQNIYIERLYLLEKIKKNKLINIGYMPRKRKFEIETIVDELEITCKKLGLKINMIKIHNVKRCEAAKLIEAIDVLLCTSNMEGYPRPPLEALRLGKLLLGFDGGIAGEYENIIYARNSQNIFDYLKFIKKLIDDPYIFKQENEIKTFKENLIKNINESKINSSKLQMDFKYGGELNNLDIIRYIFSRYNLIRYIYK